LAVEAEAVEEEVAAVREVGLRPARPRLVHQRRGRQRLRRGHRVRRLVRPVLPLAAESRRPPTPMDSGRFLLP